MSTPLPPEGLRDLFGSIDVYLFDQLLRGRIVPGMRVLDAGCGAGRNLDYLAQAGFDVVGVDRSEEAVAEARERFAGRPNARFEVAALEQLPFDDGAFDVVICNAVLHFSASRAVFVACLDECWRVLAEGGLFWSRLASSIGIEKRVHVVPAQPGWFQLPDGSQRYLVDENDLLGHSRRLGGELLDPIKTTNVAGLRCMTTWVLGKPRA